MCASSTHTDGDTACLMIAAGSLLALGRGGSFISPLDQSELVICQCDVVITKHMAWHHDKAQDCQTFGSLPNWAFSLTSEFLARCQFNFHIRLPRKDYRVGLGDEARLASILNGKRE